MKLVLQATSPSPDSAFSPGGSNRQEGGVNTFTPMARRQCVVHEKKTSSRLKVTRKVKPMLQATTPPPTALSPRGGQTSRRGGVNTFIPIARRQCAVHLNRADSSNLIIQIATRVRERSRFFKLNHQTCDTCTRTEPILQT